MRAVILAAGEGTRLRPLTETQPKVMLGVANRPILEYVVEALVDHDVTDITLVVGYQRERVQSHFGDGDRFGCAIDYAFQDTLLGTGHALAQADVGDEELLVLGGDNIVDADLVAGLLASPQGIALVGHDSETPSKYGVLTLDGDRVARIQEKPRVPEGRFVNTGVYRLPPSFHRTVREHVKSGRTDLTGILQHEIDEGAEVRAVRSDGLWMDALYPWDLLDLNARMARSREIPAPDVARIDATARVDAVLGEGVHVGANAVVGTDTSLGDGVSIGPGAILENCVVYDDARIGPGCILQDTVVGDGARLGADVTCVTGPAHVRVGDEHHDLDAFGAVIAEDVRIGGGATVAPGSLIGARARVDVGATVRGNVPADGRVT